VAARSPDRSLEGFGQGCHPLGREGSVDGSVIGGQDEVGGGDRGGLSVNDLHRRPGSADGEDELLREAERAERRAEQLTVGGPPQGYVVGALRRSQPPHAVRQPRGHQPHLRVSEAASGLAQYGVVGDPSGPQVHAAVAAHRARVDGAHRVANLPAGVVRVDQGHGGALGRAGTGCRGHDDGEGGAVGAGDEVLLPVEHPPARLTAGGAPQGRRIRAGHRHRPDGGRRPADPGGPQQQVTFLAYRDYPVMPGGCSPGEHRDDDKPGRDAGDRGQEQPRGRVREVEGPADAESRADHERRVVAVDVDQAALPEPSSCLAIPGRALSRQSRREMLWHRRDREMVMSLPPPPRPRRGRRLDGTKAKLKRTLP
jgi:hypothetical protein